MMRRGEFKTPGGKLIAVEFEIDRARLRHVTVTGDFFLYPEEALSTIANTLEGSPITLKEPEYASRVRTALGPGVELLGSSEEALAVAVMRALGDSGQERTDGGC